MVDEISAGGIGAGDLINKFGRDFFKEDLSFFTNSSNVVVEVFLRDNGFTLTPGEHSGFNLTKDKSVVLGLPGSEVVGPVTVSSDFAMLTGLHFSSADPLVEIAATSTVFFRDCIFEMTGAALSVGVDVASGGRAIFSSCVFLPALGGGTGKSIDNAGAAGNVIVVCGANLTGRSHNNATVVTTELT